MHFSLALVALLAATVSAAASKYAVQKPPLDTEWTYKVGENPWPEYPRPQMARSKWQNLNGIWKYKNANGTSLTDPSKNLPTADTYTNEVLVPSCLESGLSGLQGENLLYSWLTTDFAVPKNWTAGDNVLLNFGAVDYEATVYVNGKKAGFHRGGYTGFELDITKLVNKAGEINKLTVFVHDPTDSEDYVIPIGKQTLRPSHIFYRPCSGIWQSVWIESAPADHIKTVDISGDMNGNLKVLVTPSGSGSYSSKVEVSVSAPGSNSKVMGKYSGAAGKQLSFKVAGVKTWSPDSPNLYDIKVTYGKDVVSSYTGFRTVSKGEVNGVVRPLLNGEFVFQFGTLDQGYWPDGLYTPPNREAMVYDLKMLKSLGFNMLRKHIKTENALFYRACDEMGLMLVQDMPSLRPLQSKVLDNCTVQNYLPDNDQQKEFERQLVELIKAHKNYPSIVTWVIYNEGWGQRTDYYPEFALTDLVNKLDGTRLIDSTTGWIDHGAGDFSDNHHYANPQCGSPFYSIPSTPYDPKRIGLQGEFGGIGHNVSIEHLWNVQAAINAINQTYEIDTSLEAWNYRAHILMGELREQTELFACSGGIWTQTTDVEGEVNGLLTYDRRFLRPKVAQWKADIKALYDTAAKRSNSTMST